MKNFLEKEIQHSKLNIKIANTKIITPLRLQAYERLVLFLERISPEAIFVRVYRQGMNSEQLHKLLLKTIRTEFEHNLSQQVYVSNEAWEAVKSAKEAVLRLINTAAASPKGKAYVNEFSKIVIEAYNSIDNNPTDAAIELLKNEIQQQIF
jgi:uncharacterized radical SAM superfamily protein